MDKKIMLLYAFAVRLPFFLMLNGLFNLLLTALYLDVPIWAITLQLCILFFVLLVSSELCAKKPTRVAIQLIAGFSLFVWAQLWFSGSDYLILIGLVIFLLTIIFIANPYSEYERIYTNAWLLLLGLAAFLLPLTAFYAAHRLILVSLAWAVLCKFLALQMAHMMTYIHSYRCRVHTKSFQNKLAKNSLQLVFIYLLVLFLFSVPLITQDLIQQEPFLNEEQSELFTDRLQSIFPRITLMEETEGGELEPIPVQDPLAFTAPSLETDPPLPYADLIRTVIIAVLVVTLFVVAVRVGKRSKATQLLDDNPLETLEISDCVSAKRVKKRKGFAFSYDKAVRRAFVRKVGQYQKHGLVVRKSATAKGILSDISQYEPVALLDEMYHKARYSDSPVTKEDLTRLKS